MQLHLIWPAHLEDKDMSRLDLACITALESSLVACIQHMLAERAVFSFL